MSTDPRRPAVTDGDRIAVAALAVLLALFARIATAVGLGAAVVTLIDLVLPAPTALTIVAGVALNAAIYLSFTARRAARNATEVQS